MYKIVIWGTGKLYNCYINAVKYQEFLGKIQGVFTGKDSLYKSLDGYKYVAPDKLDVSNIDYVVVATEKYFHEVVREAESIGFHKEHILPIKIFAIPCFDFKNYIKLLHSHISIFSNNCWGNNISFAFTKI